MLALLLGCGLRRSELVHLTMEHLQQREEHWAIIDLVGKGGHVRTVPIPAWVKEAIDNWCTTGNIKTGKLFRCVNKTGSIWGRGISEKVVWCMVRECAAKAKLDKLAPHDLRRTCARLCHEAREVIEPCQIGGYEFLPGTTILFSQWVAHRDPRYFDDPDTFRPERWIEGLANRLPAGAYYPFGDGPRRCVGQGFALLEAGIVIGTLAQRFRFRLVPGHPVEAEPLVTLRPRHGIRMTVHARK
jgi:hypothetical protein